MIRLHTLEKIWLLFMAVVVISNCVGFSFLPSYFYVVALLSFIPFLFVRNDIKVSYGILLLLLVSFFSIPIGQPDIRFRSYERLGYFTLMAIVVSPLFYSKSLSYYRSRLLYIVSCLIVILCVGSFFCWFLGINFMHIGEGTLYEEDFSVGGTFGGLVKHSMLLGPLCGIACIFILYSNNGIFEKKWIKITLILCTLGALLFSASRGALIATGVSMFFYLYKKSKNPIKFMKVGVAVIVILAVTFPLWKFMLDGIVYKNEYRNGADSGFLYSRMNLYDHRIGEFLSNPLTGNGFASAKYYSYGEVHLSGTVEYGNSWLCIFSTIGLLGAIPTVYVLLRCFIKNVKISRTNTYSLYLSSLLLLFFVHFMLEGYIFSAGNPLCFLFWLLVSIAYDADSLLPACISSRNVSCNN